MRATAFALLLVGIGGLAAACPPTARVCVPVKRPVVVVQTQAVAVPVVAVQTLVLPAYAVSYNYAADNSAIIAELRALREEVVKLSRSAVPVTPAVSAPAPQPAKPARDLVGLLTSCSRCHQPATAAKLGAGFELFKVDGTVVDLTPAQSARCRKLIESGAMPKNDTFTAGERKAAADYLDPTDPTEPINPPKESTP